MKTLRLLAAAAIVLCVIGLPRTQAAEKSVEQLQTTVLGGRPCLRPKNWRPCSEASTFSVLPEANSGRCRSKKAVCPTTPRDTFSG